MKIQILGTGCARCKTLTANAEQAVQELGLQTQVEKVTEIRDIIKEIGKQARCALITRKIRTAPRRSRGPTSPPLERARRSRENVALHAQRPVLPPQPGQFLALG